MYVCEPKESSDAAPADVRVCAYLPTCVCVMPVGESVQQLCLSVRLACVVDGPDWTGLEWTGLIRAEPENGSACCDLDLTGDHCPRWHWDLVDINTSQSQKPCSE